ncbi:MAG TPA: chloride channel protein [Ferruginibacter sp.]|nr:chloride channel protein [Ferruginibacter sp.]
MSISSRTKEYLKLIVISILIGLLCAILGDSLKMITSYTEDIFSAIVSKYRILCFVFPVIGLSIIHLLRIQFFKKKENKGIKEIYDTLKTRHNELPAYKIPSHYINGFITVILGGSTGIEVSTVVASATIGAVVQTKAKIHTAFRKELIYAGIAAGITALFSSPFAGILFSLEVISKRISRNAIISIVIAAVTAFTFNYFFYNKPLFIFTVTKWHYEILPYIAVVGILSGINGVYLTKVVLILKEKFYKINNYWIKILIGATVLSAALLICPELYGDGYQSMKDTFIASLYPINSSYSLLFLIISIMVLKPIAAAVTLTAGGDGGVFAPALFIGAFLGLGVALLFNKYFNTHIIPINFMVIGMAAVLSASLHAPFTATFLVCGLIGNYVLLVPIFIACYIARMVAKQLYPYTVYSYYPETKKATMAESQFD